MPEITEDRAQEVLDQRNRSLRWMESNFYGEWEQAFKSYLCERDPEPSPNDQFSGRVIYDANGRIVSSLYDPDQTSIGMPDTYSIVRRHVARVTAQPPNVKFRADDPALADRVSRKIMRDWDKSGMQRDQKLHVAQAALLGWSVRAWYWEAIEYTGRRRVDPYDAGNWPAISEEYGIPPESRTPETMPVLVGELLAKHGRGKYLPVTYAEKGYVGPKSDFLLVADCFPEPNFRLLQKSKWFIVARRRDKRWMKGLAEIYPETAAGIGTLLTNHPNGTPLAADNADRRNLRMRLASAVDKVVEPQLGRGDKESAPEWTIFERHVPGPQPKLAYVAEDGTWLGEIDYPYDLEGRIAFTDLVFIDSLLWGIGDSNPRIIRGLQQLHDRQVCVRTDLAWKISRPLVGTTNRHLYENPDLVKRHNGMRLVHMDGPGEIWIVGEQAAMAAVATNMQDESGIERQIQKATGETNLSMAANVDPQQNRTATGARIMAYYGDVLSKDAVDMFNECSLKPDAEMMYLLNRSEMPEAVTFDGAPYYRAYSSDKEVPERDTMTVEPTDFQVDGEVEVEVGSTLADDDESKVQRAMTLWGMALAAPQKVNIDKARDRALIAMGEGRHLKEWAAPPPPPPPPPDVKTTVSVAFKGEMLGDELTGATLQRAGIIPPGGSPPPGAPTPGLPVPAGGSIPPSLAPAPELPPVAASAGLASRGRSPVEGASRL